MSQLARHTGLTREGLYKALSADGNPSFDTVLKVVRAMGGRFKIVSSAPKAESRARKPAKAGAKRRPAGAARRPR